MKKSTYFTFIYQCTPQFAALLEQKYINQKLVFKGIEKQMGLFSRFWLFLFATFLTH